MICVCVLRLQGMNYVAGSMLLLLGPGITCQQQTQQQQQQLDSSDGGSSNGDSGSSSSSNGDPALTQSGLTLEQLEAVVFECLLGFSDRVLPQYYSPAMVAPQVCMFWPGGGLWLGGGKLGTHAVAQQAHCYQSTSCCSQFVQMGSAKARQDST
jgi:hypothetical protein